MAGSLVTPCWGNGFFFFPWGSGFMVIPLLGDHYGLCSFLWVVGFMVTPHRGRGWVAWLLPAGGKGRLHGYSPLEERVGCMVTPQWGRGWVTWLFPPGEVGLMVTSRWESWFYGYSLLGDWVN